ncbi:mechanosensitive ion channel [Moraxella nasicaprae]|uniref:Small-conductance mechanosensitive channel n=1 Tax=Moraxella nasicaprae TaxID=2904122 RepID=A0ABY6F2H6_9GAMM|nr:mechanosensitive ion channel [Moraxella nasicaprae]UXZ04115.1 mechanosensitive ion channel [Moraxella nasicaprae]
MDFSKIAIFNQSLQGPIGSIIGAIVIFVLGWLIALVLAAIVRKALQHLNINEKVGKSVGTTYQLDNILSKIVFWFVFAIAISGALNQLNLNSISVPFANMINQVLLFLPNLLAAVAVGAIGWFVATIARNAAAAALNKTSLDDKLSAEAGVKPMSSTIADVIYWFILLIVLTMVVGRLGLDGLFTPLTNMVDKIFSFMPNAVMAGFVFFVGFVVAKIVRSIATNLVAGLNIQALASKAGVSEKNSLPNIAGSVAFLLIIMPFTIAALDALKVEAISRPATNMLNKVMESLPNVFTAVAVLAITYFVVRMIAGIIKGLLDSTQINALPAKIGMQNVLGTKSLSDIVSGAILFFAMLFATVAAADLLGFAQISDIVTMFIAFGSQIILGAVILTIGFWLANIIAGVVERSEQGSKFLANIVRVLIMGLVLAMGLKAMGIADSIVNLAFGLTLGAVAVAFALSFGLGGQEAAARYLRRLQDKLENDNK